MRDIISDDSGWLSSSPSPEAAIFHCTWALTVLPPPINKMSSLHSFVSSSDFMNLQKGAPGEFMLEKSVKFLQGAAQTSLGVPDAVQLMTYGPDLGHDDYRETLAEFLKRHYKTPVDKSDLVETSGATSGLHLISSVFFGTGDLVFMEEFSYFIAINILRDGLRHNCQPVSMDRDGIDPDALEAAVQSHSVARQQWSPTPLRPYWAMLYLVPQFQNPTGVCLSPERSQKIIKIARKYNLLVVCDDVYNLLYFPNDFTAEPPPQRLFAYDDKNDSDYDGGHVISNGSFSKLFAPGIRLGWLEAPQRVIQSLLKSCLLLSGGALNHAMSGIITELMKNGEVDKLIEGSKTNNQECCKAMVEVFRSRLPSVITQEPKGGYFLWLKLPDELSLSCSEFVERCKNEKNVFIFSGDAYSVCPTGKERFIRLAFCRCKKDVLVKAANLICDLILELKQ